MVAGISLANKCQLLFGFAVVLILTAALSVPWILWKSGVRESQFDVARQLAAALLNGELELGTFERYRGQPRRFDEEDLARDALWMTLVRAGEIDPRDDRDTFLAAALEEFLADAERTERVSVSEIEGDTVYRYARAIRLSQATRIGDPWIGEYLSVPFDPGVADPLVAILLIDRTSQFAEGQLLTGRIYIIAAGIVAGLLAVAVFYLILTKLILSPVRRLRETTERVQKGDLSIRSEIRTGDEFEQLSGAFNAMLDQVAQTQVQLQRINETLDLKVSELSEANIGLFESNRLKGEFLANVSHELRTPLNSIIGFAELLEEMAREDPEADDKRRRYLGNILTSGRDLLQMINQLLDMAKIEAGRMEVVIEPASVPDVVEGLLNIMRPQAETKRIELVSHVAQNIPIVETDPGKLQQILYNFLANAIKFTPDEGTVTISADRVTRQDNSLGVRLAVSDTGPGIPHDLQDLIFEKFRQVDSGHTRSFSGSGLGLAICRDLAELLGATVSFVSEPGKGATFFVDLPLAYQPNEPQPLMG